MKIHLVVCFVVAISSHVNATWYHENVENGADIMMMDIRWPWWPESTYYANWNIGTNPHGIGGYGGFTSGVSSIGDKHLPNYDEEVQASFRPGSVWSFWGANKEGEPVRPFRSSEYTYPAQYVGEGASGAMGGKWPFIEINRWYTMLLRVWMPVGVEDAQYSYVGRWVKDVEADQWYLYGIMRLPVPAHSFKGNAGFLEDPGNGGRSVRTMHRRLGYFRKDGKWCKSDTVSFTVKENGVYTPYWVVNKIEDETVLAMELSSNQAIIPQKLHGEPLEIGKRHHFTVKQPDFPTLDTPVIKNVKAQSNGKQVYVSWEIPSGASPQLYYKVEVFDNSGCQGRPVVFTEKRIPTTRDVLLDAKVVKPTVRVSMSDIFDQPAEPVVVAAAGVSTPSPASKIKTAPGLKYELLYQDKTRHANFFYPTGGKSSQRRNEKHYWLSLSEMEGGRLIQQGISRGFDLNLRGGKRRGFGFRFRGFLRVPEDGLYLFHMQGSDGYRIQLDNADVLAWDQLHGPAEKSAAVNLAAGDHLLAVDYFVDTMSDGHFEFEWEGPGFERVEIPRTALLHLDTGKDPVAKVRTSKEDEGSYVLSVHVEPNGCKIEKTMLFLGTMQIAENDGPTVSYKGTIPSGEHALWARVRYDKNRTTDSEPVVIKGEKSQVSGWDFYNTGEDESTYAIKQTSPNAFSFLGEGEFVISRKVEGDFTLTCRIDGCAGLNGEPVNPSSWVGLTAREDAGKKRFRWGQEFGVVQTAHAGIRTTADHPDMATSRMSAQSLPKGHKWLRVVRQDSIWTAWSSADGKTWHHGATHFKRAKEEMDAGIVFRALPQDARMYFNASVSEVKIRKGVAEGCKIPMPLMATGTNGPRLTGIVVAPSDPEIVVLRTSQDGLIGSSDGGKTWSYLNGNLKGAENAVRSVAIHPENPMKMYRAAGSVNSKGEFDGGLFMTEDGGKTWDKLDFPGDFDGVGPSAICGEIVAFTAARPDIIMVGCETKGLFRSEDGGQSWANVLDKGERITAVTDYPWYTNNPEEGTFHITTCPDAWMSFLGRGTPAMRTQETVSRNYVARKNGKQIKVLTERSDLGYYSVALHKGSVREMGYGTSHGFLSSSTGGYPAYILKETINIEGGRPFTAVASSVVKDKLGECALAQPLNVKNSNRISYCGRGFLRWRWQPLSGDVPGGMIAISAADHTASSEGKKWWFVGLDGLYYSDNTGAIMKKVLDEKPIIK